MEGLGGILLALGGPVLARALGRRFGEEIGEFAEDALEALGKAFDVAPTEAAVTDVLEREAKAQPEVAKAKVRVAEADMAAVFLAEAEKVRAENDQQRMTNELLLEETKEAWWAWAWRPAGMWFLLLLWFWNIIALHVLNAIFKIALPPADAMVLLQLSAVYMGLYMGGHTVKDFVAKKWGGEGKAAD